MFLRQAVETSIRFYESEEVSSGGLEQAHTRSDSPGSSLEQSDLRTSGPLSPLKTRRSRFSCVLRTDRAIWPVMVRWLGILLGTLRSTVRTHRELALENLALRQQLAVWKARQPRPQLTAMDRMFWVVLSRLWKSWRNSLQMVRPETVVAWHRQGFRRYWAWKSRRRRGRPAIRTELRDLIRRISRANPLWGAPRIHGELLKLGLTVSQATVSKYMLRPRRPPVAGVAHVFGESRQGSDRVGFLHGAHGDFS